jgi:hypothetical protein
MCRHLQDKSEEIEGLFRGRKETEIDQDNATAARNNDEPKAPSVECVWRLWD